MTIWRRINAPVGLLAVALSGVTACATTQAPPTPPPADVRPAEPDAIRFLTREYDVRFAAVSTGALVDVPTGKLGDEIGKLLQNVGQVLQRVPGTVGSYDLDEIQISLTVDAKGGVIVTVGATAGLTLTLKRRPPGASSPAPASTR